MRKLIGLILTELSTLTPALSLKGSGKIFSPPAKLGIRALVKLPLTCLLFVVLLVGLGVLAFLVSRLCIAMRFGDVCQRITSVNDRSEFPVFDKLSEEIECRDASLRHCADDSDFAGACQPRP